jgi:hypothetical protein
MPPPRVRRSGGAEHNPDEAPTRRPTTCTLTQMGLTRVDSHPNPQRSTRAPVSVGQLHLARSGGIQRVARGPEGRVDTVTRRLDDVATMPLDRTPQDLVVAAQRRSHRLRLLLSQPRRALQVREQERDRPRRQINCPHPRTPLTASLTTRRAASLSP